MESICIRVEKPIAEQIEKCMKEMHYSTKTEFIRDALRDKLKRIEDEQRKKAEAWERLFALRGAFKGKGRFKTYEEWHKWRSNEGSRELMKYLDKKFGIKDK